MSSSPSSLQNILIGTGSEKVYCATFDSESGNLSVTSSFPTGKAPTWLLASKDKNRLFAVNEQDDKIEVFEKSSQNTGDDGSSFANSKKLAEFSSGGETPCFLSLNSDETLLTCANYNQNFTVFDVSRSSSLEKQGSNGNNKAPLLLVGDLTKKISDDSQEEPVGPQKDRQDKSHPHMTNFSPCGNFLIVPDLGTDTIAIFKKRSSAQEEAGSSSSSPFKIIDKVRCSKAGLGPRHCLFHPKHETIRVLYVVNELASSVSVFEYCVDEKTQNFSMKELETHSCLPAGKSSYNYGGSLCDNSTDVATSDEEKKNSFGVEQNTCASINIAPSSGNRFLYVSCRGRDAITAFKLDEPTGRIIDRVGEAPSGGRTPRFFCLTKCGNFAIVLNQDSDSVVVWKIDGESGKFVSPPVCVVKDVKSPQCVEFV